MLISLFCVYIFIGFRHVKHSLLSGSMQFFPFNKFAIGFLSGRNNLIVKVKVLVIKFEIKF